MAELEYKEIASTGTRTCAFRSNSLRGNSMNTRTSLSNRRANERVSSCDLIYHEKVFVVGYALNAKKMRKRTRSDVECAMSSGAEDKSTEDRSVISMPWTGGGLADLMSASVEETKGIRFVAWDPDTPVQLQPKFDLIIHKLTEDIEKPESSAKLQALDEYLNKYPSTVIVDPISAVSKVTSRIRTNECLSNVQLRRGRSCPFRLPRSVVVQDGATPDEVIYQLEQKGLQFPVICKPVQACGTPDSHRMMVIVSHEDLHLTPSPCVVQQYHDHQEMLYKVYVMEDDVMIFRRSSLPNLEEALHEAALPSFQQKPSYDSLGKSRSRSVKSASRNMGGLKSLSFDSRYKYPTIADFRIDATDSKVISISSSWDISNSVQTMGDADTRRGLKRTGAEDEMEVDLPVERGRFVATAMALKEEFGLSLFGFDVIIPANSSSTPCKTLDPLQKELVIIDINFFPSYKEVSDFPQRLCDFLKKKATHKL